MGSPGWSSFRTGNATEGSIGTPQMRVHNSTRRVALIGIDRVSSLAPADDVTQDLSAEPGSAFLFSNLLVASSGQDAVRQS